MHRKACREFKFKIAIDCRMCVIARHKRPANCYVRDFTMFLVGNVSTLTVEL